MTTSIPLQIQIQSYIIMPQIRKSGKSDSVFLRHIFFIILPADYT